MNRRLLLLFVSIVITFAVKAQATYSLSFNVGDYSLRTSGGLLSVFSSKTDERAVGGEHAPDLASTAFWSSMVTVSTMGSSTWYHQNKRRDDIREKIAST